MDVTYICDIIFLIRCIKVSIFKEIITNYICYFRYQINEFWMLKEAVKLHL